MSHSALNLDSCSSLPLFQLSFDGNVCCSSCLYALELCAQICTDKLAAKGVGKGCCVSCNEKVRTFVQYPFAGFSERLLALPYFSRLQKLGKCKVCCKCVHTLEFVKKLSKMIELYSADKAKSDSMVPKQTPSPPQKTGPPYPRFRVLPPTSTYPPPAPPVLPVPGPPPSPPESIVEIDSSAPSSPVTVAPEKLEVLPPVVVTPPAPVASATAPMVVIPAAVEESKGKKGKRKKDKEKDSPALPPVLAPPPPPIAAVTVTTPPPAPSASSCQSALPPIRLVLPPKPLSPPANIKLPRGITWSQLSCYVKLDNMRVPPIKIRDLKIQSILKTSTPEKASKRVSFDNVAPRVFQFKGRSRLDDSLCLSKSNDSSSSDEENMPLIAVAGGEAKKRKKGASFSIAKRPRRASTLQISYEEPSFDEPDETDEDVVVLPAEGIGKERPPSSASTSTAPPTKRFKVFRPSPKEAPQTVTVTETVAKQPPTIRLSLNVAKQMLNDSQNGEVPPPNVIAVSQQENGRKQKTPSAKHKSTTATVKKNLFTTTVRELRNNSSQENIMQPAPSGPWRDTSNNQGSPLRSPLRRPRRGSLDNNNEGGKEKPQEQQLPQQQMMNGSPERRGGSAGKISNRRKTMDPSQSSNQQFKLRVVPLNKLLAPTPQIDLLLSGVLSRPVLPPPYQFQSP